MAEIEQNNGGMTAGQILSRLTLLVLMIGLLISTWFFVSWLYKPGNFSFQKVELVNRLENQQSNELQKVVVKAINGGFFSLNVDLFRADIVSSLPWVKAVAVRKVWPNKLLLSISEHKPAVRWTTLGKPVQGNESGQLLSKEGIIFLPHLTKKQQQKFNRLPMLTGPVSNAEKILQTCLKISKRLTNLGIIIQQCGMNERRTWMLKLSNEMDVKLGKEQVMQKLERFVRVFSGQLKPYLNSVAYADLRYTNGFSIKWNSDNTEQVNTLEEKRREQE